MKLTKFKDVYSDPERIREIARLVWDGIKSPVVHKTAHEILTKSGFNPGMEGLIHPSVQWRELEIIFSWVKKNIAYRNDPYGFDAFHSAERILEMRGGDCDDHTILLCSLLGTLGWIVGCRIIASKSDIPFHHIYAVVVFPKNAKSKERARIVPLDSTIKFFKVGDEVRHEKERTFIFVKPEEVNEWT